MTIEQTILLIALTFAFFVVKMIAGGSVKVSLAAVVVLAVVFVGGGFVSGMIQF